MVQDKEEKVGQATLCHNKAADGLANLKLADTEASPKVMFLMDGERHRDEVIDPIQKFK